MKINLFSPDGMMMKAIYKYLFFVFILLIGSNSELFAAIATSDNWDDMRLHGWKGNTAWTQVSVVTSGGNPGGYLSSTSKPTGNPANIIGALTDEDRYTGNYTAAGVNQVSFDLMLVSGQANRVVFRARYHDAHYNGWYYRLTYTGQPLRVSLLPISSWVHFDVPFNPRWSDAEAKAAGWEQEPSCPSFSETMSDVYTIEVRLYSNDPGNTTLAIDNFVVYAARPGPITKRLPPDFQEHFTGLWFEKSKPGNGVALEIQGRKAFLVWFSFNKDDGYGDETNATIWVTCSGNVTEDNWLSCRAQKWRGWQWGQAYEEPTISESVCRIDVKFHYGNLVHDDSMDFYVYNKFSLALPFTTKNLVSFMENFAHGAPDSRNLTGWWYDPAYNGMGLFIEARGEKMALVWYNYGENGEPRWWTSIGNFPDGAPTYTGVLDGWRNGQCYFCYRYKKPKMIPGEAGDITIDFIDSSHATMNINGTILNIERFTIP